MAESHSAFASAALGIGKDPPYAKGDRVEVFSESQRNSWILGTVEDYAAAGSPKRQAGDEFVPDGSVLVAYGGRAKWISPDRFGKTLRKPKGVFPPPSAKSPSDAPPSVAINPFLDAFSQSLAPGRSFDLGSPGIPYPLASRQISRPSESDASSAFGRALPTVTLLRTASPAPRSQSPTRGDILRTTSVMPSPLTELVLPQSLRQYSSAAVVSGVARSPSPTRERAALARAPDVLMTEKSARVLVEKILGERRPADQQVLMQACYTAFENLMTVGPIKADITKAVEQALSPKDAFREADFQTLRYRLDRLENAGPGGGQAVANGYSLGPDPAAAEALAAAGRMEPRFAQLQQQVASLELALQTQRQQLDQTLVPAQRQLAEEVGGRLAQLEQQLRPGQLQQVVAAKVEQSAQKIQELERALSTQPVGFSASTASAALSQADSFKIAALERDVAALRGSQLTEIQARGIAAEAHGSIAACNRRIDELAARVAGEMEGVRMELERGSREMIRISGEMPAALQLQPTQQPLPQLSQARRWTPQAPPEDPAGCRTS